MMLGDFVRLATAEPATVPLHLCHMVTKPLFASLQDNHCILVDCVSFDLVGPDRDVLNIEAVDVVDFLMRERTSIRRIPAIAKKMRGRHISYRLVEATWQRNLVARDICFLKQTDGLPLALQYDTTPVDKCGSFHGGHYTATWRSPFDGRVLHHHLSIFLTIVQHGDSINESIKKLVTYFRELNESLRELGEVDEESSFELDRFCMVYVDRGAAMGKMKYTRVNECIHRLHRICTAIASSLKFEVEMKLICHAANYCASAPEFKKYLKDEYNVQVTGFLWQRATTGRFATSWGACFSMSALVGKSGKTVLEVLIQYLSTYRSAWETSTIRTRIYDTFSDASNRTTVRRFGFAFSTIGYPLFRAVWGFSACPSSSIIFYSLLSLTVTTTPLPLEM
jgi:hypothetical protein